jgi:uncharacterized protein YneF (UPF0154 family)
MHMQKSQKASNAKISRIMTSAKKPPIKSKVSM